MCSADIEQWFVNRVDGGVVIPALATGREG